MRTRSLELLSRLGLKPPQSLVKLRGVGVPKRDQMRVVRIRSRVIWSRAVAIAKLATITLLLGLATSQRASAVDCQAILNELITGRPGQISSQRLHQLTNTYNANCLAQRGGGNDPVPQDAVDCGGYYCHQGTKCGSRGQCIPENAVDCGGYYCSRGQKCSRGAGCISADSVDCGEYACGADKKCAKGWRGCLPKEAVDCGPVSGKGYCKAGFVCTKDSKCITEEESERRREGEQRRQEEEKIAEREQAAKNGKAKEEKQKQALKQKLAQKLKESLAKLDEAARVKALKRELTEELKAAKEKAQALIKQHKEAATDSGSKSPPLPAGPESIPKDHPGTTTATAASQISPQMQENMKIGLLPSYQQAQQSRTPSCVAFARAKVYEQTNGKLLIPALGPDGTAGDLLDMAQQNQFANTHWVSKEQMLRRGGVKPGDLVFWQRDIMDDNSGHVAMVTAVNGSNISVEQRNMSTQDSREKYPPTERGRWQDTAAYDLTAPNAAKIAGFLSIH